jgi:hypothetical protein
MKATSLFVRQSDTCPENRRACHCFAEAAFAGYCFNITSRRQAKKGNACPGQRVDSDGANSDNNSGAFSLNSGEETAMQSACDAVLEAAMRLPENERLVVALRLLKTSLPENACLSLDDASLLDELDRRFADHNGCVSWSELHVAETQRP